MPSSKHLAEVFNEDQAFRRELQERNIYKLDGCAYAQAVPDGRGGVIMRVHAFFSFVVLIGELL